MATINRTFSIKNGLDVANTIVIDSNRSLSNINTANIVTLNATGNIVVAGESTSNVFISSKTAVAGPNLSHFDGERLRLYDFDEVGHPNYAIGVEQNHIWMGVDSTANNQGFKWYGNTNVAMRLSGNGVLEVANTVITNAFITVAGLNVTDQANAAYAAANAAANTVRVSQNSSSTLSGKQLNFVNSASILINVNDAGDGNANILFTVSGAAAGDAYNQANAAYAQANAAYAQANSAYAQANLAYDTANLKVASINVSGNGLAVTNTTVSNLNQYTLSVNTASTTQRGTTLLIDSVTSSDTGNAATANAVRTAWDYANTKLSLSGGTIDGDLNVAGNLVITGNTTYQNVETYIVDDPLIYLAANNETSDLVDIGFMGGHNTAGVYQHSGLIRHAVDGNWYLFTGLAEEGHENNVVDVANTTYATLKANLDALLINTISANVTTLIEAGNAILGAANVTGAANLGNTLEVTGATTLLSTANISGVVNVANTLDVTGNVTVTANVEIANDLVVTENVTVNGIITVNNAGEGLVVGNANVTHTLTVGTLNVSTNTIVTSSNGQVVVDTFPSSNLASAKYFVQANSGLDYLTTEIVIVQDGTNVWLTEYGTVQTGPSLGTFTADINSGDVRLLFTANNAVNTVRAVKYGVLVP